MIEKINNYLTTRPLRIGGKCNANITIPCILATDLVIFSDNNLSPISHCEELEWEKKIYQMFDVERHFSNCMAWWTILSDFILIWSKYNFMTGHFLTYPKIVSASFSQRAR